jgi:hypothetical protein
MDIHDNAWRLAGWAAAGWVAVGSVAAGWAVAVSVEEVR